MKKGDKDYILVKSVLLAGMIITACGGETYRAEDTMGRMLVAGGATEPEINVFSTSLSVSFVDTSGEVFSISKRIKERGIDLGKITVVNDISRRFCSGAITVEEAYELLLAAEKKKSEYPTLLVMACQVLTPIAFTILLGGKMSDCVVSGLNGIIIALITAFQKKMMLHPAMFNFLIGLCVALFSYSLNSLPFVTVDFFVLLPGSIMALLPGVTLTNGVHDLLNADFMSGGARLTEAVVTATTLAVGVGFGLAIAARIFGGTL
ncbi:MAG: threonine/serine exporter family protein [Ruminococcaceae bacterium]|nr:threonine/serine exporter family protein [Oscillospiraceae bacterium]